MLSRAAHNELEKNRRANLRNYLDSLKLVLPSDVDTSRDTTLSLLTRARNHIRVCFPALQPPSCALLNLGPCSPIMCHVARAIYASALGNKNNRKLGVVVAAPGSDHTWECVCVHVVGRNQFRGRSTGLRYVSV